jgi:prepilin-type N-terminal cleavage/methylation domain-containing protein
MLWRPDSLSTRYENGAFKMHFSKITPAPKIKGRFKKRPGFTLLEIVAVLIILGLITATAMMVTDNTDYNLLSQAQAIRQNIRYAQSMAMKTGAVWGVESDASSYWAFEVVDTVETLRSFPGQETPVVLTDVGVSLAAFKVYFNGFGQPGNAAGDTPSSNYLEVKVGPAGWDFTDPEDPPSQVAFRIMPDTGYIEVVE